MTDLTTKTLAELSKLFQNGEITSREITEAFIQNIEARDDEINAFITRTFDEAREMADAADARFQNNSLLSPLDGMPFALKDCICTKGIRTTSASKILDNFIPSYDATVWKKLKDAGVVLLGKLNTDEFTMGASTENSAYGVVKNPHDTSRVAGGSSGGPAAAIAANFCAGTIGTETGGSIRCPANFCGISGLKVSYGRVSRYGTIPMASSLDTIGPMAKTAEDCAMIMEVIAGNDIHDSTTLPDGNLDFVKDLNRSISGMTIGIPKEYLSGEISTDVMTVFSSAKKILEDLGVNLVEISLPHTKYAIPVYYIIAPAEISANMARYDGIRFGQVAENAENIEEIFTNSREKFLGDEVKRRILIGTYVLSAGYSDKFYKKAQQVRTLIRDDFSRSFEEVDAILAPISPTPAFKIGEKSENPLEMYLEDALLAPSCLTEHCGIAVPIGNSRENLPIGIQIICPTRQEDRALRIAHQMEQILKD